MKRFKLLGVLLLCSILMTACGSSVEASSVDAIYTAVAMTLTTGANAATATPTPQPTATGTPEIVTLIPTVSKVTQPSRLSSAGLVSSAGSVSVCDNSAYVSDVTIADGTSLDPGEEFTKTWRILNSGTCTWTSAYAIAYASGNSMSGATTSLTDSIAPNGTIDISVEMVAPTTAGSYTGYWKLQNASGTFFGSSVYVQIVVSGTTSTCTPTSTSTDEDATSTPTTASTSTIAPTATTVPTETSTPVESSTETPAG